LLVLVVALLYINTKEAVYQEFTCSCCETSLADSSCLMAGGMREYIDGLVFKNLFNKDEIIHAAVKKFGISTLRDKELKITHGLEFVENPPKEAPSIVVDPVFIDLGEISMAKGLILTDFEVYNNGTEELVIYDLKTSCSCVTASFIKEGYESVRLGRFSQSSGWTFILKPGEESILRTYFDPRITNWQTGHVERLITITSNDPLYFERTIKLSADIIP